MSNDKNAQEELARLDALTDQDVDTVDIPQAPEENWLHARRGEFYRPIKRPVTIRLQHVAQKCAAVLR
jgi:hypothetical protein